MLSVKLPGWLVAMTLCGVMAPAALAEPESSYRSGYRRSAARTVEVPGSETEEHRAAERPRTAAERAPLRLAPRQAAKSRELRPPSFPTPTGAVGGVVGSLAAVLGVFLVIVWLSKRMTPAGSAPLPKDAVELLGRTALSGQHAMQLVRVGGRLLLISLSPQGASTLMQISDPTEVERILGLVRKNGASSISASFQQTLADLQREPSGRSFVDPPSTAPQRGTQRTRA
jgi:flagellar biogenesis protein FliO